MHPVRMAVVGMGSQGNLYARLLRAGIPGAVLSAVVDRQRRDTHSVAVFPTIEALCASKAADAAIVTTPHPTHGDVGIQLLDGGLHLLMDKPLAADAAEARRLIAHSQRCPDRRFAALLNLRTDPRFLRLRDLIISGALGTIRRVAMTATDWFRPDCYYDASPWRGTWEGEGGGVLINQCSHQLDLLTWLFGPVEQVSAWCRFGGFHAIDVEDEAHAMLRFQSGATGVFIASTGEAPGSNRLEVATDHGLLTIDGDTLEWKRTRHSVPHHRRTATDPFFTVPYDTHIEVFTHRGGQHSEVMARFAAWIRGEGEPVAHGHEGLASVELANAIQLSAWEQGPVSLPFAHERHRRQRSACARLQPVEAV